MEKVLISHLVIEAYIDHHHLSNHTYPTRATRIMGIHTSSKPDLLNISRWANASIEVQHQLLLVYYKTYFMIFSNSPHYIYTSSYMHRTHSRVWRFHCDPRSACE